MQRVWRERVLPCMHHQPTTKRAAFLLFAAYADRKDIGAAMTEQKRGEQIAFMYPQSTYSQRHSARQLPRVRIKTRQELEVQARNQVADEADPSYSGHSAGIEPEHRPFDSQALIHSRLGRKVAATRAPVPFDAEGENDLEEDESYYTTRHPTSSRRYQRIPDVTTTKGSVKVVEHHHQQPLRTHRQSLLPPRQSYSDEDEHLPSNRHRHIHPLFWIGVCGVLLVLGWMGLNFITSWYQGVQDDWTYGKQRHFEVDAVVGHGDSVNNPTPKGGGFALALNAKVHPSSLAGLQRPGGKCSPPRRDQHGQRNHTGHRRKRIEKGDYVYRCNHKPDRCEMYYADRPQPRAHRHAGLCMR